jgi:hypothetical protein
MKRKKKKYELDPELQAQSEELRRQLQARIEFHERRREQLRRERGEAQG